MRTLTLTMTFFQDLQHFGADQSGSTDYSYFHFFCLIVEVGIWGIALIGDLRCKGRKLSKPTATTGRERALLGKVVFLLEKCRLCTSFALSNPCLIGLPNRKAVQSDSSRYENKIRCNPAAGTDVGGVFCPSTARFFAA